MMVILLRWSFKLIYPNDFFTAKLRAQIAAKLGEALGSLLRTPEDTDRAVRVMPLVTTPQKELKEGLDQLPPCWRYVFIAVI
jgi:hypothetical protein